MTMTDLQTWKAFLEKMDWEGGVVEMLTYGGPAVFPSELREDAQLILDALERISSVVQIMVQ